MRISEQSAQMATTIITNQFGPDAKIWLFGSRADDSQRGGDVDLFVEAAAKSTLEKIKCQMQLTALFDLKVDLVVGNDDKPIHRIAKSTGVRLK